MHPYRNYQKREVAQIVEAYHCGIAFDKTGIERILRTNLEVMWNGDRIDPKFRNSDVTRPGYVEPAALPGVVSAGESTVLAAKPTVPGRLEIAVYRNGVRQEILLSADVQRACFCCLRSRKRSVTTSCAEASATATGSLR